MPQPDRLGLQEINIVLSKFQILADYPTEEKCAKILSEAEAKYNHFRDQSQRYRRKEKYKRGYKIWEAAVRVRVFILTDRLVTDFT